MHETGSSANQVNGLAERSDERFDVVVVGGGQAGLAIGYFLARQRRRFVILEAADWIGARGGPAGTRCFCLRLAATPRSRDSPFRETLMAIRRATK